MAANKEIPSSRASIQKMHAAGLSYHEIGRRVGRNDSLIRQIALGKKPGENLRGSLAQAARGEKAAAPERRKTAAGTEAHVRRGAKHYADGSTSWHRSTAASTRRLLESLPADAKIRAYVSFRRAVVGGEAKINVRIPITATAGQMQRAFAQHGTAGGLAALAAEESDTDIDEAQGAYDFSILEVAP